MSSSYFFVSDFLASISICQVNTHNLKSSSQGWSDDDLIVVPSYFISSPNNYVNFWGLIFPALRIEYVIDHFILLVIFLLDVLNIFWIGNGRQQKTHNFLSVLHLKALYHSSISQLTVWEKVVAKNHNFVVAVFSNLAFRVNSYIIKDQYCISTLLYHLMVKLFQNISLISTCFNDLNCLRNLRDLSKLCCCIYLTKILRVCAAAHGDWCANSFIISTYGKCQGYLLVQSLAIFLSFQQVLMSAWKKQQCFIYSSMFYIFQMISSI